MQDGQGAMILRVCSGRSPWQRLCVKKDMRCMDLAGMVDASTMLLARFILVLCKGAWGQVWMDMDRVATCEHGQLQGNESGGGKGFHNDNL